MRKKGEVTNALGPLSGCSLRDGPMLSTEKRVQDETGFLKKLGMSEAVDLSAITQVLVGFRKLGNRFQSAFV